MLLVSENGTDQEFPGPFHYADDYIFMPLQAASQWDGLAHVFYDEKLYNGFPSTNVTPHGAHKCSIIEMAKGITGRGVLLDLARLKGVEWMEQGYVITPEDLDAAAAAQGVEVGSGDILLFRTGWRRKFIQEQDAASFMAGSRPRPGLRRVAPTTTRWPPSARTTGPSRSCPARRTTRSSPCTWCSSGTWA